MSGKVARFAPIFLALFVLLVRLGQTQPLDCPTLVRRALEAVDQLCDGLERNSACYGSARVGAAFAAAVDLAFSQPADRVSIGQLRSLQTFPLDEEQGLWGVALMNVQANLPGTLPGQAVKFLLYGDVSVQNAGQEQAPANVCQVTVSAASNLNLRSGPGTDYNVVTVARAGSDLDVIGRSEDGTWLYAGLKGNAGWVFAELVMPQCDVMADVAVRDPDQEAGYGPMQAFYFTTGIGEPACAEAPPSSLVIQSPQGYVVKLNVNGVDVSVGSTVSLTAPEGQMMNVATLEGRAITSVGSLARVIPEGFSLDIPLAADEAGNLEPAGSPGLLTLLDPEAYAYVEELPDDLFDLPVEIPDTEQWSDIDEFCADPANAELCGDPLFQNGLYVCGDAVCDAGEYCPDDCGEGTCGDGICDPFYLGEDESTCAADCGQVNYCGDFYCGFDEDADTCPNDCGEKEFAVCGNYVCEDGEDADLCPVDCGAASCGDFVCDPASGEDQFSCPQDCGGTFCGVFQCDPASGEDSAACPSDCAGFCGDGVCNPFAGEENACPADCGGGEGGFCGDGVCNPNLGEDASTCANDCSGGGDGGFCGDGVCKPADGEDGNTCPADCGGGGGGFCGDNVCDPNLGEDGNTCPGDCGGGGGFCGDNICDDKIGEDSNTCPADCGVQTGFCGDNICDPNLGEDSGTCPADCGG